MSLRLFAFSLSLLLAACAGTPEFDTAGVDPAALPRVVAQDPQARGTRVFWGGVIAETRNLETVTHIQAIAFPLDAGGRPRPGDEPQGRFIIEQRGFLEPAKYAPGREVTVVGEVITTLEGRVGQAPYRFPVVRPRQLHLWPAERDAPRTTIHFGIGVGIYK